MNLKGPWHENFDLCFFLSNKFPLAPDTRSKAFSNIASNWRRYWTKLVAQRCQWHRCATICSPMFRSTVSYAEIWFGYTRFNGFIDTAVQIWHRCDFGLHIREALATFKGIIYRKNIHRQWHVFLHYIMCTHKIWRLTKDRAVIDTAVTKIGDT
jgi:hypothetical protein